MDCPKEHDEQVAVVRYARERYGHVTGFLIFAVPNGGSRHIAEARRLTCEGVTKGVPDLCIPLPRGLYHGLFIEMKRRKGGVVSPEQREICGLLERNGYMVRVCKGSDEAIAVLDQYMQKS